MIWILCELFFFKTTICFNSWEFHSGYIDLRNTYTHWDKIIYRLVQSVIRSVKGSVNFKRYNGRIPVKISQIYNNFISYLFGKIRKDDWASVTWRDIKTIRQIYAKCGVIWVCRKIELEDLSTTRSFQIVNARPKRDPWAFKVLFIW